MVDAGWGRYRTTPVVESTALPVIAPGVFLLRSSASFSHFDSLETNKQLIESFLKLPVSSGNSKSFENGAVLKRSKTRLWHRLVTHAGHWSIDLS